jgi:hypothetical protein
VGSFLAALQAFEDKTAAQADEIVLKFVLEVRSRIIVRTPVDSGRARNNWQYGLDAPPGGQIGGPDSSFDRSGVQAEARIATQIPAKAAGHVHYLVNNVHYIQSLEDGSSQQAPNGMVKLTLQEAPQILDSAVRSVR